MTQAPRTLAEWLRARDDDWLRGLIVARPDVSFPPPGDFTTLAQRLAVRVSVNHALDDLTAWELQVLEGLLLCSSPASADEVQQMLPDAAPEQVHDAIERLRSLALIWGEDDALNVVGMVRESASRFVAGLGRPASELLVAYTNDDIRTVMRHLGIPYATQPTATGLVVEKLRDPVFVRQVLDRAPDGAADVLDRLSGSIPAGELSGADQLVDADNDTPAVRWLLSHGMLAYVGPNFLELPREVGLVLRAERPLGPALLDPPVPGDDRIEVADANGAGATHLQDAVRQCAALIELVADQQPRVLRTGGLGSREAKKLAKLLEADPPSTHLLLHIAQAAGLIAQTSTIDAVWLPTERYDEWRTQPVEQQWAALATAWLSMSAQPWLSDGGGSDSPHVLSDGTHRASAAVLRRRILVAAEALGLGTIADPASVAAYAAWRWPKRMTRGVDEVIAHTLREAEYLGVTGRGALSAMGRALLSDPDRLADVALDVLPEPVDHVLLQADHTAIAPGRLSSELAADISTLADVESAGGATVFRISEASLRRALDRGLSAADVHRILKERSRTPVPQSLTYLVDDVSRRHGVLRIGGASAYLRCDDESTLDSLLSHATLSNLRLRRLAPTVLVCHSDPDELLSAIREAGFAPSFEDESGAITLLDQQGRRSRPKTMQRPRKVGLDDEEIEQIVHRLRTGEQARSARRADGSPSIPGVTTASTLELLNAAVERHDQLSMDYVDENARMSTRLIVPSRLVGGYLYAYDLGTKTSGRFAVHRIMGVYHAQKPAE